MSERLQSGYHPDADQISAFAEHALPAHEREQMLDHLAACAECRAVVAMSLPEIEEREPARQLQTTSRRSWWPGWTLAWPLTGALAALVVSIFFIRHAVILQNTQAPNQVAGAHAPEPRIPRLPSPSATDKAPSRGSVQEPNKIRPAVSAGSGIIGGTRNVSAAAKSPIASPQPAQVANAAPLDEKVEAPAAALSNGLAGGVSGTPSANAKVHAQSFAPSKPVGAAPSSPPPAPVAAAMAPIGQSTQTVSVQGAASRENESHNAAVDNLSVDEARLAEFIQVRSPLPSHLAVLSMAARGRRMIAIDTQNAVFFSNDAGKNWKAVQAPWPGRALKAGVVEVHAMGINGRNFVQLQAAAPGASAGAAASPGSTEGSRLRRDQPSAEATCCSLTGTVTDQTGAVIPGASVTATDAASHATRTAQTDSAGRYVLAKLTPGTYQLEAAARGFTKQERAGVAVTDSRPTVADVSLSVGSESQTVTVETPSGEVSPLKKTNPKAKPSPDGAPVFEIVTDNGDHWTSSDGTSWRPK